MVVAAATEPDIPDGLVAEILDGRMLRAERIAECRRRLAEGPAPDAEAVADAMVREVARCSHPALR